MAYRQDHDLVLVASKELALHNPTEECVLLDHDDDSRTDD